MTTICFKDGVLAFDSLVTSIETDSARKDSVMIKGIKTDKHMVAGAGDIDYVQAFLKWAKSGFKDNKKPHVQKDADFEMIVVDRNMKVTFYSQSLLPTIVKSRLPGCYVLGSGSDFALGALAMGATAEQAVRIAAKYHPGTGGRIRILTWRENEIIKGAKEAQIQIESTSGSVAGG